MRYENKHFDDMGTLRISIQHLPRPYRVFAFMRKPKPIRLNSKNKTTTATKILEVKAAVFILLTTQMYQKTTAQAILSQNEFDKCHTIRIAVCFADSCIPISSIFSKLQCFFKAFLQFSENRAISHFHSLASVSD